MFLSRRFITLLIIILVRQGHSASFDCDATKAPVENLICGDDDLSHLDEVMFQTYRIVMSVVSDKATLKTEQKRWLTAVQRACKDEDCLQQAYEKRIAKLENNWNRERISLSRKAWAAKMKSDPAHPFDGLWESCELSEGHEICSSYTLVQAGNHVCGETEYYATGTTYTRQLQATTRKPGELVVEKMCSVVLAGGEIQTICDDEEPETHWEKVSYPLIICDAKLFEGSCASPSWYKGFMYYPMEEDTRKGLVDEEWVKTCLSNSSPANKGTRK